MDLEEKLHRCEADRLNCVQLVQLLEGQLQGVRGELSETLQQLRELRDVLQRTQTISDERQASVEKLTVRLRWGHVLMWNLLLHTGTRDEPQMERTSTWSSTDWAHLCLKQYPHCTCVSQTHQQTQTSWSLSLSRCLTLIVCLLDNVATNLCSRMI